MDPLHGQSQHAASFYQLEDLADVGVMDARSEARFFEEHLLEFGLRQLGQYGLDGDQTIESACAVLTSSPDLRHSAARDGEQHLARAQPRSRRHLANRSSNEGVF